MSAHGDGVDPGSGPHGADEPGDVGRRIRLVALLDGADGGPARRRGLPGLQQRLGRLCAVTASEVGVDGAGITVMSSADAGLAGYRDQLAATGDLTRRLEDLQLTAGEGPCLEAYATGRPVLAADLAADLTRWVGFGPEALAAGAAAAFSLPLQVGAVRLGTLDLHRASVGPLSRDQLADALVMATLATEALLELAEQPDSEAGAAGDEDPAPQQEGGPGWLPDVHADVHVASGMVSARARIDVGAALLRIRAYAFASGEPIGDVARRIIAHDLVLTDDQDDRGTDDPRDDHGPPAPDLENDDS